MTSQDKYYETLRETLMSMESLVQMSKDDYPVPPSLQDIYSDLYIVTSRAFLGYYPDLCLHERPCVGNRHIVPETPNR